MAVILAAGLGLLPYGLMVLALRHMRRAYDLSRLQTKAAREQCDQLGAALVIVLPHINNIGAYSVADQALDAWLYRENQK